MIGIISAMQEEIQALLNQLKNTQTTKKGMRTYHTGTLFNENVVLVFSRWGKVASATTTTQLINDFNLREIIFTGVAGALKSNLNIGDIVIGKHLYQHDMDASPLFEPFEIPLLQKKFLRTKNTSKILAASKQFTKKYSEFINPAKAQDFGIKNPKVLLGNIASGDQFINSVNNVKNNKYHTNNRSVVKLNENGK